MIVLSLIHIAVTEVTRIHVSTTFWLFRKNGKRKMRYERLFSTFDQNWTMKKMDFINIARAAC